MTDRAETTWSALAEIIGPSLVAAYGPECPPLWRSKIAEFSDAQLQRGLQVMADRDSAYAPSLGQFASACRGDGERRTPMLPPPIDRDVSPLEGALNLILLRKLMRAGGVSQDVLRQAVAHKRTVARQLNEAYPRGPRTDEDKQDIADMEPAIGAELDRILGLSQRQQRGAA